MPGRSTKTFHHILNSTPPANPSGLPSVILGVYFFVNRTNFDGLRIPVYARHKVTFLCDPAQILALMDTIVTAGGPVPVHPLHLVIVRTFFKSNTGNSLFPSFLLDLPSPIILHPTHTYRILPSPGTKGKGLQGGGGATPGLLLLTSCTQGVIFPKISKG